MIHLWNGIKQRDQYFVKGILDLRIYKSTHKRFLTMSRTVYYSYIIYKQLIYLKVN